MKKEWHKFLLVNRRERQGIAVLSVLLVSMFFYLMLRSQSKPEVTHDFEAFEDEIDAFLQRNPLDLAQYGFDVPAPEPEYFPFDPNALEDEGWLQLGFTGGQLKAIRNYQSKGGTFRRKEDVAKMYVIDSALYASIEPYIQIPDSMQWQPSSRRRQYSFSSDTSYSRYTVRRDSTRSYPPRTYEKIVVLMNTADTLTWRRLKGIGPSFSRRIVKYRESLGGFIRKEQLLEIYGFPQETFDTLVNQLTVDSIDVKRLDINTAGIDDLRKHPYITWNIAQSIVSIRNMHGPYRSIADVQKSDLVDPELYAKLAPYLSVSQHAPGSH